MALREQTSRAQSLRVNPPANWGETACALTQDLAGSLSRMHSSVRETIPLGADMEKGAWRKRVTGYASARNSYSSITAATDILVAGLPPSTRTTRPLQRTRMLSVNVISGGRVKVKSIAEPAWMAEST